MYKRQALGKATCRGSRQNSRSTSSSCRTASAKASCTARTAIRLRLLLISCKAVSYTHLLPVREELGRFKYVPEEECPARYQALLAELDKQIRALTEGGNEDA